jgi:MtrB/PioB family decaheme-associated outer membrane protein
MRNRLFVTVAALLLITASARAQEVSGTEPGQTPTTAVTTGSDFPLVNQLDFGIRGTLFSDNSDRARFQRYRDVRDGGTVDLFRFTQETPRSVFKLEGDHVGYRDQRFFGSFNHYGKVKATFEWNQVPLFYSEDTRTLYSATAPGVLTLPVSVQQGLQDKTTTLPSAIAGAALVKMDSKRDMASFNLLYSATDKVDFNVTFRNTQRNGVQPYAISYGISNAIASEFAAPVDQRTSEFGAALQWSNEYGFVKLAYDGSFFRNNLPSLTIGNPLRATDSPTGGPAFGRLAGAPDTEMNTGSAMVSAKLPAHSRATGFLSIGNVTNNTALLPFTSNTAIAPIALDRQNADLTARVTAMNYGFTSSPVNYLWLSARFRQYTYDNRSPEFFVGQLVNYDTSVVTENEHTELLGFTRRTVDGDASVTPFKYLAVRGGYTRFDVDYANPSSGVSHRMIEKSVEDTGRVSVDLTNVTWLTVRGIFERSKRVGDGLNIEELIAIGEQPSLRQFDISDRTKDSFRGIVTVMPVSQFSVNASAGIGTEEYPGTNFGLRNNDNNVYSLGADFAPVDKISMGVTYGYEKYTALQASRTANPLPAGGSVDDPTQQFNDPRRDWTDDATDNVRTWNASVDLLKVIPKTELRVGYDYSKGESTYVYGLAPNTTIAAPIQLPAIRNTLQRGTIDGRYFITQHLAAGLVYWFDKYDVTDFALGPTASLASPATGTTSLMLLGNYYRPYQANTFWARLSYFW